MARTLFAVLSQSGDMEGLHVREMADAPRIAPLREASFRIHVRLAGVVVIDLRGEKLDDALGGLGRGANNVDIDLDLMSMFVPQRW